MSSKLIDELRKLGAVQQPGETVCDGLKRDRLYMNCAFANRFRILAMLDAGEKLAETVRTKCGCCTGELSDYDNAKGGSDAD